MSGGGFPISDAAPTRPCAPGRRSGRRQRAIVFVCGQGLFSHGSRRSPDQMLLIAQVRIFFRCLVRPNFQRAGARVALWRAAGDGLGSRQLFFRLRRAPRSHHSTTHSASWHHLSRTRGARAVALPQRSLVGVPRGHLPSVYCKLSGSAA